MPNELLIRDLGGGLILRHATKKDAGALAKFNSAIHGHDPADGQRVAAWTRDLLTRPHPTLTPGDFTIVEETATQRIVSTLNLIPQTWTYEGIPFGVGRPELVGTHSEFRGRGLVRIQFEEVHKWCAERDLPVQVITGIPYFYRQFGYEMALDLAGRRFGFEPHVQARKRGQAEQYRIRPATEADLPFLAKLYTEAQKRYAISCARGVREFAYELNGQSRQNVNYYPLRIIEDKRGKRIGYLQHTSVLGATGLSALGYELVPGASWLEVTPVVARYLWDAGGQYAKRDGQTRASFGFMLGTEHPVYEVLGESLPAGRAPYAYYMRVPDLPGFIQRIAPALEERLARSLAAGYSGTLKISFYRDGLRLVFVRGRLKTAETWTPVNSVDEGDAAFPGLTFLQLLFGYRSFDELRHAFKDCYWEHNTARILLNGLFPKRPSDVAPLF